MSYPVTGTCQCGSVHYTLTQAPLVTVVCHCTDCQKLSAGAFSMTMLVKREHLRIERGDLAAFDRPANSGNVARCYFCPTCSNRIYHENPEKNDIVRLKPGTLDDTNVIAPDMHVWTGSKQDWVDLPDNLPCYEAQPDMATLTGK